MSKPLYFHKFSGRNLILHEMAKHSPDVIPFRNHSHQVSQRCRVLNISSIISHEHNVKKSMFLNNNFMGLI